MKPLHGIRVVDFTHAISGPTATQMLLQLGAEIIKIEPKGKGDDFRHYTEHAGLPGMSIPFAAVNAGKKSVALDLKVPEGKVAAMALVKTADIVVENFRPGVIARLGFGYDALKATKPDIIMLSLSGFGQSGPWRDWGAYDHIAQAASGMAMMNATADGPMKIGIPVVDSFSGYLGVIAVLAALRTRDAGGSGQWIDVAMLDAAIKLMGSAASVFDYTGDAPKGTGNRGFRLVATAEYYACADGWIALGANHQHQIEALFAALGQSEMIADPRFKDHVARVENYAALKGWLTTEMLKHQAEPLEVLLTGASVPATMIRNIGQTMQSAHVTERGILQQASLPDHEAYLAILGPGFATESADTPAVVPVLGADTETVLAQAGYDADALSVLREAGAI